MLFYALWKFQKFSTFITILSRFGEGQTASSGITSWIERFHIQIRLCLFQIFQTEAEATGELPAGYESPGKFGQNKINAVISIWWATLAARLPFQVNLGTAKLVI